MAVFAGCVVSQQHASVSQGWICSDNFTCCHTEIKAADPLSSSPSHSILATGPTSPSADPITPGAWHGSHWSAHFEVIGMTRPEKIPSQSGIRTPGPSALEADALITPTRRSRNGGNIGLWLGERRRGEFEVLFCQDLGHRLTHRADVKRRLLTTPHRLLGPVVKASTSGAKEPGFESRL